MTSHNIKPSIIAVKITMCDHTQKPKVRGGSLDNGTDYIIDNIHFHWGTKDTEGCEHTVSGKHFQVCLGAYKLKMILWDISLRP